VSDSKTYDITHPNQVLVTQRLLLIGLRTENNTDSSEPPDRYTRLDTDHVTQIAPMPVPT